MLPKMVTTDNKVVTCYQKWQQSGTKMVTSYQKWEQDGNMLQLCYHFYHF